MKNKKQKPNVDVCGICCKLNEVQIVTLLPYKGILRLLRIKIKANICQSCGSKILRGYYKSI